MLTLEQFPPIVSLSGNPVRFSFCSDTFQESPGERAVYTMTFSMPGIHGDSFTLSWGSHALKFTYSDQPDESGSEVSSAVVEPHLHLWIEMIAGEVAANYLIDRDFEVSYFEGSLILTSRKPGPEYNLSHTFTGSISIQATSTEGVLDEQKLFYRIGVQCLLVVENGFDLLAEEFLPVDGSGKATIDIHDFFSDVLSSSFTLPEASNQRSIYHPEMCHSYVVRYFEQSGVPTVFGKISVTEPFYVLFGGLSSIQEGRYLRQGTDFWSKLCYNQYFLTWQPKTKWVDPWQVEKLYYLVREEYPVIVMRVETYYQDGLSTNPVPKVIIENPVNMGVYEFILTLDVLQPDAWDSEYIDYYEAWIEDGQLNRISEVRRFRVAHETPPFLRHFLFRNSLGGWDTLRTTGKFQPSYEYDRSMALRIPELDSTDRSYRLTQTSVTEQQTFTANTGWLSMEEMDWVRDFCLSGEVYEIINRQLYPVVLTSKSARQAKDGENLWCLDFEYSRSITSGFHTREVVVAPFNNDFNDDYTDR